MTRIRLLLISLLAAVLVVGLSQQKRELTGLPATPVPPQWTSRTPGKLLSSTPPAFAVTAPGRAAKTARVLARGWEHDNGDAMVGTALPVGDGQLPLAVLANPGMKDETVICGQADLSNCGYTSKKGPFPLNLRRSGAGIALTISKTNIWIEPHGLRFSTSVSF